MNKLQKSKRNDRGSPSGSAHNGDEISCSCAAVFLVYFAFFNFSTTLLCAIGTRTQHAHTENINTPRHWLQFLLFDHVKFSSEVVEVLEACVQVSIRAYRKQG
jgi:exosortase/archaeosortase